MAKNKHPLSAWLRAATPDERSHLANCAGTSVAYLYQLSGCFTKSPSTSTAYALTQGAEALRVKNQDLPVLTMEDFALGCQEKG